jgi:poly(glycerol-phosphate) alpha-glucosyltransferase
LGLLTASASRLGGGVFEAVVVQAELIRQAGGEAIIFTLEDAFTAADKARFGPSEVIACPVRGPRQIGFAPGLVDKLLEAGLDCLHLHGIWMYPSRAATVWAKVTGRPYLVSPHGMLDRWITGRGRWKKALARLGYERTSWRAASRFHALTGREAEDILAETGRDDSLIIPNAGPQPQPDRPGERGRGILFISRIHPKKNLAPLVEAWIMLDRAGRLPAGARLTIAGWGDPADLASFKSLLDGTPDTLRFIGPCFGPDKARELAKARFVILPSLSEGLPMTLLEAWAAGTPTLQSTQCHLPEAFSAGAALDCGMTAPAIAATLEQALALGEADWQAMSRAALGLARGAFAPARIAERWSEAYGDLIAAQPGARL